MAEKRVSVMVGVPSTDLWAAEFGMCLGFMLSWSMKHQVLARSTSERVDVINFRGSILSDLRQKIVRYAQERNATHLLFLDSDQTFPKDLIRRLIGHEQPVVAANIPTKTLPATPTARLKDTTAGGTVIYSHEANGLQQVWRVGTGVMMIDMEVFEVLDSPFFPMQWDESVNQYRGEDWMFCEKLEQAGLPVFIDHTLSRYVGHCGSHIYTHKDIPTVAEIKAKMEEAA